MPDYEDYEDVLNTYNFLGSAPGTSAVPSQPVTNIGSKLSVSYTYFRSSSDVVNAGYYDPMHVAVTKFTGSYRSDIENAIAEILDPTDHYSVSFSDVINVVFEESSSGTGAITFGQLEQSAFPGNESAGAVIYHSSLPPDQHADIWISNEHDSIPGFPGGFNVWDAPTAITAGTAPYKILMEEISHALGIDIRENGTGPITNSSLDSHKYTVTSYNSVPEMDYDGVGSAYFLGDALGPYPKGLQLFDIAALQAIYGRNYETRDENTTYSEATAFSSTEVDGSFVYTIWDGGGVDTIDASGFGTGAQIDLRQGHFSSIGYNGDGNPVPKDLFGSDFGNVAIAFHSVIEHAIGTDQNDTLIGNGWSNTLMGGDGDDILYGDGVLYDGGTGYQGVDHKDEDDPNRTRPHNDIDVLDGGEGNDTIYVGEGGIDYIDGGTNSGDADTLIISRDLNYWTGKGVMIGGTIPVDSDHHFAENIEMHRVQSGVGGYYVIRELGNLFDNMSATSGAYTTFNYRSFGSALEFHLDANYTTNGVSSDYYTNYGGIVGTNHGDDYYLTENHSYVHVFSGSGNDNFLGSTGDPKQVFYGGGADIAEDRIGFTLPIGIEISDLAFAVADPQYTHHDIANGRFYWTADLILTVGSLGTITYDDQIVWYDDYDDFEYGITQSIPNIFVQLEDGVHAIAPDYEPTYPYTTPIPTSLAVNDLYIVSGSAFWGTWGNDDFSFHTYENSVGADIYYGMGGDDIIRTPNRDVTIWAGEGDDTVVIDGRLSSYVLTLTDHVVLSRPGLDLVIWSAEEFQFSDKTLTIEQIEATLHGSGDGDALSGNTVGNILLTWSGNDELSGLAGDDILDGGDGNDIIHGGDDEDYLIGGAGDDVLNGDDDDDTLYGGSGSDELNGGSGADFLVGGTGDDLLAGGAGDDAYVYSIGDGYDEITEEGGFDSILLGAGITEGDLVFSRVGNDLLISSAVLIAGFYSGDPDAVVEEIRFSDNSTLDLTELLPIFGTSGDDNLNGNAYGNFIYGLAGYDELHGGDGDDVLDGGDDDDSLYGGDGDDTLYGGDGNDYAYYSVSFFDTTVTEDSGVVTIVSDEGTDTLHDVEAFAFSEVTMPSFAIPMFTDGTSIADFMFGSSSIDIINGRGGNDTIHGYEGVDMLGGGDGDDVIYGGEDSDILSGGDGDDELYANTDSVFTDLYAGNSLYGGAGNDLLVGSDYYDYLFGGDGNDTLIGMGNGDHYYGGAGADTFVFMTTDELSIYDFDAYDKLDVSALLTAFDPLTDLIADFVSFATDSTNSTMSVDRDGTGTVEDWVQIAFMADAVVSTNAQDHLTNGVLIV